jgi:16S rRNA (cytosine967-C5)-methyltransferase
MKNNKKWGSRDRRFFAETVYDCVRWWRLYWYLLDQKEQPPTLEFLAPSLWRRQLEKPYFDEYLSIDFSEFEKRMTALDDPSIRQAFPAWLYQRMQESLPEEWQDLCPYFNETNSVVLRVNESKTTLESVMKSLSEENIQAQKLWGTTSGLILEERANVFKTKAFKNGWFEVQDGASQQVASFLKVEPGQRVVDACAGAGGKTLHMADLMNNKGQIVSLDIHEWKLNQLKLRARRDGFHNIERKVVDSTKTFKRLKNSADRLLLDVPCTGLGVLRRNPDTKWKLTEQRIKELIELQKLILTQYSPILKSGGLMVYSTCSVLPEENELQIENFLKENPSFSLEKQKSIYPVEDGYDGFFMALLKKS